MVVRVIQWATGAMGKTCLRAVLDDPAFVLAGLLVYGENKDGRDAGDIARRDLVGVAATRDRDAILATPADIVIHAPRIAPPFERHDDDICALLASGKNVISINGNTYPPHWAADRRDRFTAACDAGGTTFMGAGLNPGFAGEKLAVLASGLCTRVDSVDILETVVCADIKSSEYVFDVLGFGAPPETVDPNDPTWGPTQTLNPMYEDVVACVAERLGATLDHIETDHRVRAAPRDISIAAGVIPKGTVSHVDWLWRGVAAGRCVVSMRIAWAMDDTHLGGVEPILWRVRIDGSPTVRLTLDLERPEGLMARTSAEQLGVAGAVLNAIPHVIAAPPGLIATSSFASGRFAAFPDNRGE